MIIILNGSDWLFGFWKWKYESKARNDPRIAKYHSLTHDIFLNNFFLLSKQTFCLRACWARPNVPLLGRLLADKKKKGIGIKKDHNTRKHELRRKLQRNFSKKRVKQAYPSAQGTFFIKCSNLQPIYYGHWGSRATAHVTEYMSTWQRYCIKYHILQYSQSKFIDERKCYIYNYCLSIVFSEKRKSIIALFNSLIFFFFFWTFIHHFIFSNNKTDNDLNHRGGTRKFKQEELKFEFVHCIYSRGHHNNKIWTLTTS